MLIIKASRQYHHTSEKCRPTSEDGKSKLVQTMSNDHSEGAESKTHM